jgi:hypothetical protein
MEHIHFVIYRLKSIVVIFFLDIFLPLSRLIIGNPHRMFKLEGRKMIFQGDYGYARSLILKEKTSDKVLEVFVLFLLILSIIIIFFMFYRKIKYEGIDFIHFLFLFYLFRVDFRVIPSSKVNECLKGWISSSKG